MIKHMDLSWSDLRELMKEVDALANKGWELVCVSQYKHVEVTSNRAHTSLRWLAVLRRTEPPPRASLKT